MSTLKLVFMILILIFLAVFINIEVTKLKIKNKELLEKIDLLEQKRVYYENLFLRRVTFVDLEKKAENLGLCYPKDILRIKINNGHIIELKKERYFSSLYKNYSFNYKP